jgi:hypothetical protein
MTSNSETAGSLVKSDFNIDNVDVCVILSNDGGNLSTSSVLGRCDRVFSENGIYCGNLGEPSLDNQIRLYSKEDCDKLAGRLTNEGECLIKSGGSYSWDCRFLNPNLQEFTNISRSKKLRRSESFYGGDDLKCKARY